MNTCRDCFNLIAKIPIIKGETVFHGRLKYTDATAYCKEGMLTDGKGVTRIFKNVLKGNINKPLATFKQAERCPEFDGEMEELKDYIVECCNEECAWSGKRSETSVFKHDVGKENIPLFCPECHEICEPVDFDV